jgi:hypothetical protein
MASCIGVRICPGRTALHRMPDFVSAQYRATERVSCKTLALDAP